MNLVKEVMETLRSEVAQSVAKAKEAGKLNYETCPDFIIEVPKDKDHGDFASNVAMTLTKQAKMKPRDIAQAIVDQLDMEGGVVDHVEIAGPGFINFYLKPQWIYAILPAVQAEDTAFGSSDMGRRSKGAGGIRQRQSDRSSAYGQCRGGALGDSLTNCMRMAGYEVSKEYYINDAGNRSSNWANPWKPAISKSWVRLIILSRRMATMA